MTHESRTTTIRQMGPSAIMISKNVPNLLVHVILQNDLKHLQVHVVHFVER